MHEICTDPVDARTLAQGASFELEIGCGRGGFVFERVEVAPNVAFIGLEVKRKWACIVDARLHKLGLAARARVFAEDAKLAMPRLTPDALFDVVFLHFPDPWWKKKHGKRLMVADDFLEQVVRLLKAGGNLYVQTDVEERALQYEARIREFAAERAANQAPTLVPNGDDGGPWLSENPYGARSPREHRAIADGMPVYRLRVRKA
jgi:tRNA (guanine-N7-)-methyltransferase